MGTTAAVPKRNLSPTRHNPVPCRQDHALHFQQDCPLFQIYSSIIIQEEFRGSLQAGLMKGNDYALSRIRQADFIHLGLSILINLKSSKTSASLSACATKNLVTSDTVSCSCSEGSYQNCHKLIQKHFIGWKWWWGLCAPLKHWSNASFVRMRFHSLLPSTR